AGGTRAHGFFALVSGDVSARALNAFFQAGAPLSSDNFVGGPPARVCTRTSPRSSTWQARRMAPRTRPLRRTRARSLPVGGFTASGASARTHTLQRLHQPRR